VSIEDSPEFKKALQEECERQYRSILYGKNAPKVSVGSTAAEVERQRREIEKSSEARLHANLMRREAEIMGNPHAREITENLRALHSVEGGLVCPQCGETDSHGNKMNGHPFCFRCQLQMISKEKAEKWIKPPQPKKFSRGFNEPEGVVRFKK
jgi:hypothetical protein